MRKRNYKYVKLERMTQEEFIIQNKKFQLIYDPSDISDKRNREDVVRGNETKIRFIEKIKVKDLHAEFRQDLKNRLWLVRDVCSGLGDENIPVITIMPKVNKKERV